MRIRLVFLLVAVFLLAGCSGQTETAPTAAPTETSPSAPTPTATPSTPLTILVMPADLPREQYDAYQALIYDLAQANGMRFQVRNTLSPEEVRLEGPALKVVIVFPPDPGLAELAAAAPQAQFLAVGLPGATAGGNISIIGIEAPLDKQAFLAGYTAAMLAEDYRVGMISLRDDPQAAIAVQAFENGYRFYCGLCTQQFPPWYNYPIVIQIPPDERVEYYPAYGEAILDYLVEVTYVYPPVATPDLLDRMATYNMLLISERMPFPGLQPNWVMSIEARPADALAAAFPALLAGQGGQAFPTPLALTDINPEILTEGKQRLVQQVLDDLQAGYISTGVTP
ncbi:MAG: hypothetical protein ABWK53_13145 [Anaerolineales bacterium]